MTSAAHVSALPKALAKAFDLLSYRRRTESELRRRLGDRFEPDVVDRVIERLAEQRLVDDAEFARAWRSERVRRSPRSARAILWELVERGVARHLAEAAVDGLDDEATARSAASKFARRLAGDDYEKFHRRMWGHLQRRGYSAAVARRAMSSAWRMRRRERERAA